MLFEGPQDLGAALASAASKFRGARPSDLRHSTSQAHATVYWYDLRGSDQVLLELGFARELGGHGGRVSGLGIRR